MKSKRKRDAYVMRVQCRADARRLASRAAEIYRVDVFSHAQLAPYVKARYLVMYALRQRGYSTPAIADAFTMNHTSVLHAMKRVRERGLQGEAAALDDRETIRIAA